MFVKTIDPQAWNFDQPPLELIKAAVSGGATDLQHFIKRAGHYLGETLRRLEFPKDELPAHLIAVGATEYYGPNRNADGFREAVCKQYGQTFKKYARFYRNHRNKDPKISYGVVKEALYNPDMHRIELIVGINKTAAAAQRNGNLYDPSLVERLLSDRPVGVSMACRVAHDVCSWCGNKARNRNEYCDSHNCTGGGLKKNAGAVLACGHILHADNPQPQFFDISEVTRPADRTAYITGVLDKSAEASLAGPAKEVAEAPPWLPMPETFQPRRLEDPRLLDKLAELEEHLDPDELACGIYRGDGLSADLLKAAARPAALTALARYGVILPLADYLYLHTGNTVKSAEASAVLYRQLPGVYRRMRGDSSLPDYLKTAQLGAFTPSRSDFQTAAALAPSRSLLPEYLLPRVRHNRLFLPAASRPVKLAAARPLLNEHAEHLARCYAAYTLAALDVAEKYAASTCRSSPSLTRCALLTQNRVY